MNRQEMVDTVAANADLTKAAAAKALDAVFDAIGVGLQRGAEVRVNGFGTFAVAERPAGEARNPRTGEKIQVAASKSVKLKPAQALRDRLNSPHQEPEQERKSA